MHLTVLFDGTRRERGSELTLELSDLGSEQSRSLSGGHGPPDFVAVPVNGQNGEARASYGMVPPSTKEVRPRFFAVDLELVAHVLDASNRLGEVFAKDLGDAETVSDQYHLEKVRGTHAIGHVRMATESDVDISGAHPYWAYPFSDIAVVHNGQLTNYFQWRRRLERAGHRFQSECDSEIIAVYLAERMDGGDSLEEAMHRSLEELDGVFTYLAVTGDELGMAKDELAAKPLVLYEGDDVVALASEEIAIRAVLDREIETYDPYESEVMVWSR